MLGLGGVIYALTEGAAHRAGRARPCSSRSWSAALALVALVPVERRREGADAPAVALRVAPVRRDQRDHASSSTAPSRRRATWSSSSCELGLGYSAAQAGAALIPSSVVFLALSPLSGALVARFGPRWLMVAGILLVAAAFVWLSRLHRRR